MSTPIDTFFEVYAKELWIAVDSRPGEYRFPLSDVPRVAEKMKQAVLAGSYNHDGYAFKSTCKKLGIKYTRRGIEEYLKLQRS